MLTADVIESLGLVHSSPDAQICVVVISHDCDLANDDLQREPDVEVIIGRHPLRTEGNFSWAKAPRTLHVDVLCDDVETPVELMATDKILIPKERLAAFEPDARYMFSGQSLSVLRSWLGVRYNRASFPDPFVNKLSAFKTDKKIVKAIGPKAGLLSAIYFDVDDGQEVDHADGSPYLLKIVLVYPPGDDPDQIATEVDGLEDSISKLFTNTYFDEPTGVWKGIALVACMSISEDDLTVSQARQFTQWRLEYMTLKEAEE
ncbi:MAG TPA: hypothetical protein PLI96_11235 [Halothiobacillus sp.]|nr:hypothetical protein [Halothiobacillus sp.]